MLTPGAVPVGVSLKIYFGHADAQAWCERVAEVAAVHPGVRDGSVELFVIPGYLQVLPALTEGGQLADVVPCVASIDPVMGGVDR